MGSFGHQASSPWQSELQCGHYGHCKLQGESLELWEYIHAELRGVRAVRKDVKYECDTVVYFVRAANT